MMKTPYVTKEIATEYDIKISPFLKRVGLVKVANVSSHYTSYVSKAI